MREDGVTLVELIIVIAIIGIIAVLATIDVSWFMRDTRVTESRDRLIADIEDVKLRSVTGVPHGIFVVATTNYTIRRLGDDNNDFKRDTTEWTTIVAPGGTVNLPTNMKISLNGGDELWFDRKGVPRTANWGITGRAIRLWYDADADDVLDGDESYKEVNISSDGRIKYEQ